MIKNMYPIKGYREGLLITLGEGEWQKVCFALLQQIDAQINFYHGAKIAIDVGERTLRAAELGSLRDEFIKRDVNLFAILSKSAITEAVGNSLGLYTEKAVLKTVQGEELKMALLDAENAILIKKNLRSGTRISYPGHIIVFGDVNPGAEVIANGNIIIWGRLRGVAQAGSEDDTSCSVSALVMEAAQLRIGNILSLPGKRKSKGIPEKCIVKNGELAILPWDSDK